MNVYTATTKSEILVVLHLANGDEVRTAYPASMAKEALAHFAQYLADGKPASMTNTAG